MTDEMSSVGQLDAEALGARLRVLRKGAGLTLRELADALDISASAVSQIERGVRRPSVSRLLAIVQVLGRPLADVFDETGEPEAGAAPSDPSGYVLARSGASKPVTLGTGVVFRRLSPATTTGVDFFESTYPAGSVATDLDTLITHEGYEVGTVTAGELTIDFPDERVVLRAGDSITFPCALPHRMGNTGTVDAVATWLIVHS
ncbi:MULTISPECIES: helix-turn-helix domain-containing protein [unclassified Frondihabitans]|uniref:helix-turn-helix domain-containing protein n=1 Tax=unclassified Frondihabitans TaxID=2626248 RepID=UPI0006F94F82|nr:MULTISPECIES: helix-turn-helix domain-containing protein [unclassified Frondihabitans]KQQ28876.1 transcriptional regulator [Frondihabitans sp. Leaf304]MBF4577182.1 helix-turn-helix domain-containing protein [Frondihabitans sp. VKM Ac-2883]